MTSSGFDALEASCNALVADTFNVRDETGDFVKAVFTHDKLPTIEAEYTVTQQPTVQAVDFDGDDLSRAEQATIQCERHWLPAGTTSLPEDCMVELPDSGKWSIDKLRGTVFGPNWVTVYLSRKPLAKQTARRKG